MPEAGDFRMRPGIIELIAAIALSGVEGAAGSGVRPDHPEDARKRKNLSKGIRTEIGERQVAFELDVNMEYGKDFIAAAGRIQSNVKETVEAMTGWEVTAVNVNVVGVNAF